MCKKFKFDHINKCYMHSPAPVLENDTHKHLWDFNIQTDQLIPVRIPDLIIINKKEENLKIVDFAVPADDWINLNECEKIYIYIYIYIYISVYVFSHTAVLILRIVVCSTALTNDLFAKANGVQHRIHKVTTLTVTYMENYAYLWLVSKAICINVQNLSCTQIMSL